MGAKIHCRILVDFHGSFQFFQAAFFSFHQMQFFHDFQSKNQNRPRKRRMKNQNKHGCDTEDIQTDSQIENRKDFCQIPVQEALSEQNKPKSHYDQHRFVSDRDDHQNHR